ncbi:hypothetical protein [Nostoc sp. KVJ20]|uniref:hypothetical protein n=1 Tax=Nostoc sp. KVJ20 TaxID=457944 RepID=UPI00114D1B2A|nr:hypothetical protein [Nostoc sp. KVJ20]
MFRDLAKFILNFCCNSSRTSLRVYAEMFERNYKVKRSPPVDEKEKLQELKADPHNFRVSIQISGIKIIKF